jgi:hypothetical protein
MRIWHWPHDAASARVIRTPAPNRLERQVIHSAVAKAAPPTFALPPSRFALRWTSRATVDKPRYGGQAELPNSRTPGRAEATSGPWRRGARAEKCAFGAGLTMALRLGFWRALSRGRSASSCCSHSRRRRTKLRRAQDLLRHVVAKRWSAFHARVDARLVVLGPDREPAIQRTKRTASPPIRNHKPTSPDAALPSDT